MLLLEDCDLSSVKQDPQEILDMIENGWKPSILAEDRKSLPNSWLYAFAWNNPLSSLQIQIIISFCAGLKILFC